MMMGRDYEMASGWPALEYGGGGYIKSIEGRSVTPHYAIKTSDDGKVLTGYAALFKKPFFHRDNIKMFLPGAFSDAHKRRVEFWMNHDSTRVVGSTDDELELHSDERGLAFRLHLPDTRLGYEAKRLVIEKEYTGMSVGCKYKYRTETISGEAVQVIHSAALEEISLVPAGAIAKAFATLTTADRSLIDDCRTGRLASDGAFVELMRACQRVMAASH